MARLIPARRSDLFMLLVALAATGTVLVNALALQTGRHSYSGSDGAVPLPVPAPAEMRTAPPLPTPAPPRQSTAPAAAPAVQPVIAPAARVPAKPLAPPAKPAAPPVSPPKPVTTIAAPSQPTGIGALSAEITGSVRPPADVAISPRVLAVQKALANIGYGPIRIDGRTGAATKEAIERFERDRRLPISGEISERVVRELNAVAGTSIE